MLFIRGELIKQLILDTDIDTDCDDTGALAVLHQLARAGHVKVLGMVCSIPIPACVSCLRAINHWYKRDAIPVGSVDQALWQHNPMHAAYAKHRADLGAKGMLYNEPVGKGHDPDGEDAVALYRRLLEAAEPESITICAIGTLTALAALLCSPPDTLSPLTGQQLVAQKVSSLVCMASAAYPDGKDGFNWRMDIGAAALVVQRWPTPLAVQTAGTEVLTGKRFMAAAPPDNPVRQAYRIWLGSEEADRCSWDQLTVLYAVLGAGALFAERSPRTLAIDPETGTHRWSAAPDSDGANRIHVSVEAPVELLATTVEHLMIDSIHAP